MVLAILLVAIVTVPSAAFTTTSLPRSSITSLQAWSVENFREDSRYKDPYTTSKLDRQGRTLASPPSPRRRYNEERRYDEQAPTRYNDEYRRTHAYGVNRSLVNPRNDVYNPSQTLNRPRYDDDYRRQSYTSRRSLANPRNDVYARGDDRATEVMVDHELAKIQAMGKYAIQNELVHDYGLTPRYNLEPYELACLLLKARLSNGHRANSSRRRVVVGPLYTDGNPGSWAQGTGTEYWRN